MQLVHSDGQQVGLLVHRQVQECCKMFCDGATGIAPVGAPVRLKNLADVLSTLMPLVGRVPDDNWKAAKLYAPHAAKVLAELQAVCQEPTAASAWLLACSAHYSSEVLLDYQQALGFNQQLLEVRKSLHCDGDHPDIAWSLHSVGASEERLGKYKQAL